MERARIALSIAQLRGSTTVYSPINIDQDTDGLDIRIGFTFL